MSSVNKIILIGRLGQHPDIKTAISGAKYALFSVATNRRKKIKGSDSYEDDTQWHRITVLSPSLVTYLEKGYLKMGDPVYLEGRMEYKQSQNMGPKTSPVVVVDSSGTLVSLKNKKEEAEPQGSPSFTPNSMVDDEIPF